MHSQKSKASKALVIFFLVALSLVVLKNHASSVRITAIDSSAPLLKTSRSIPQMFKKIIPFASFREENALLRKKIDYLAMKLAEAKLVMAENDRLRGLLDFKKTIPYTTIPAQVIGRDPSNWSNSIIIDKGSSHGVKQNRAVISVRGLVGRLVEVGKVSSRILLITDPGSKVGVVIERNRQGGILIGRPDGTCRMIYIALDSDAVPGDKVVTAGFGYIFPKDIVVGDIIKVQKEPGRLYKSAVIRPAQDLSKAETVLCLR